LGFRPFFLALLAAELLDDADYAQVVARRLVACERGGFGSRGRR
jgi:hypothetical protein